ncbi:unnamed protein product [Amoebophrya sp. A120]|nr:unnamed protein product [Amoebophrya sp. A120]|eukprot:GSA120T00008817001.1
METAKEDVGNHDEQTAAVTGEINRAKEDNEKSKNNQIIANQKNKLFLLVEGEAAKICLNPGLFLENGADADGCVAAPGAGAGGHHENINAVQFIDNIVTPRSPTVTDPELRKLRSTYAKLRKNAKKTCFALVEIQNKIRSEFDAFPPRFEVEESSACSEGSSVDEAVTTPTKKQEKSSKSGEGSTATAPVGVADSVSKNKTAEHSVIVVVNGKPVKKTFPDKVPVAVSAAPSRENTDDVVLATSSTFELLHKQEDNYTTPTASPTCTKGAGPQEPHTQELLRSSTESRKSNNSGTMLLSNMRNMTYEEAKANTIICDTSERTPYPKQKVVHSSYGGNQHVEHDAKPPASTTTEDAGTQVSSPVADVGTSTAFFDDQAVANKRSPTTESRGTQLQPIDTWKSLTQRLIPSPKMSCAAAGGNENGHLQVEQQQDILIASTTKQPQLRVANLRISSPTMIHLPPLMGLHNLMQPASQNHQQPALHEVAQLHGSGALSVPVPGPTTTQGLNQEQVTLQLHKNVVIEPMLNFSGAELLDEDKDDELMNHDDGGEINIVSPSSTTSPMVEAAANAFRRLLYGTSEESKMTITTSEDTTPATRTAAHNQQTVNMLVDHQHCNDDNYSVDDNVVVVDDFRNVDAVKFQVSAPSMDEVDVVTPTKKLRNRSSRVSIAPGL